VYDETIVSNLVISAGMFSQIVIAAFLVMLTSLVGVLFIQKTAAAFMERNLGKLISFAAGVFLVTAVVLALEVFHLIDSPAFGVGLIIFGYALAWAMHYLIPESHHHHDDACGKSAKKLIVGDAIHNIGDGIILVPAFMASTALGITVTLSIIIHEVFQEISEFFVLRRAGYSVKKALAVNFAVSGTIFVGVAIGALALATNNLEGALLALTAGFFLHVVFHDLFPKKTDAHRVGTFGQHVLLVLIGAILMLGISLSLKESHAHGDGGAAEHTEEESHN
jgi:zinc and cadmium transporter